MGIRVAFDASALAKSERTGIARYGVCLLDALTRVGGLDPFVLGYRASRIKRRAHLYRGSDADAANSVRYFLDSRPHLTLGRFDLFHGLDARLPRNLRVPAVATLHDTMQLELPEIASDGFRNKKVDHFQRLADHADRIICVSAATRDRFLDRFSVAPERMRVVHHGIEPRFRVHSRAEIDPVLRRLGIAPPYLLFVGLLSTRKNCARLIDAFNRLTTTPLDDGPLSLVLAGAKSHGFDEIEQAITSSPASDRIVLPGFIRDADLPPLYAGAAGFVFPGLAEGFGLPILEAMACGTPVIAADTPVTKEVGGDAVIAVDTRDADRLAATIGSLLADPSEREGWSSRGLTHARRFHWDEAAKRTIAVYQELVTPSSRPRLDLT